MKTGLDDILEILTWLSASKTPTVQVEKAFNRLRKRVENKTPIELPDED